MLKPARARDDPRESTRSSMISRERLETLEDLLRAIGGRKLKGSHLVKMLDSTAAHVVNCLGQSPDEIDICRLLDFRPAFKTYLKERRFKRNSIRSYCNYIRILLQQARELGWVGAAPELVEAWQSIRQIVKKAIGCRSIVDYAIANGTLPRDFTDATLADWTRAAIGSGHTYEYVRIRQAAFRRLIFQNGLNAVIPGLPPPFCNTYGVPFKALPSPLREQVIDLVKWKVAEFAPDRPRRAKIRPICAEFLKREFCRIYGFATKVLGKTVTTLQELLNRELITAFAAWCLNERKVCGRSVEIDLARICGIRSYPLLASMGFSWVPRLMERLPRRSEEEIQAKKDGKWLNYDILAGSLTGFVTTWLGIGH